MRNRTKPTVLVTGTTGQIGFELLRALQGVGTIVGADRNRLDLNDFDQIRDVVRAIRPSLIVNPAAYTAVDQAEDDIDAAMRANAEAPGVLAEQARAVGAALIHYSTDYVFDGSKEDPYTETDQSTPLNVYGASKLAGEQAIEQAGGAHLIFRTSWVYGIRGRNFFRTMLRLGQDRPKLQIVADQIGAPTWSATIATVTAHIATLGLIAHAGDDDWWHERTGVYNLTAAGSTSWAGFADAIFDAVAASGRPIVEPIPAELYPTRARRPKNSRLSNGKLTQTFGVVPPDWRDALRLCAASLSSTSA
ncbi:dTDP-4-dehydrorhamnose reductase [Paraburkholderia steynii]|uniref:dTDP-4-dehydrorhamnose reductase n=1 Tax=Paraburkholderia steynii TaxID=1245441 RepID=A0A4R0XPW7_9BURK|nr:dTDP-4-dehydrorhamnose reductase [Paraburkholderia steynii]